VYMVGSGTNPVSTNAPPGARWPATPAKQRTWSSWVSRAKKVLKTTYTSG